MGATFAETFPRLLEQVRQLYDWFVLIAVVIVFAGFTLAVWRGMLGDLSELVRALTTVAVLALVMRMFPTWFDELQRIAHVNVIANVVKSTGGELRG